MRITRFVQSSVLLEVGDNSLLTDPWFSQRPGYYWGEKLGVTIDELPRLNAVVVSHIHYDHCDVRSFASYGSKDVKFVVKPEMGKLVADSGFKNVTELETWQSISEGPFKITATPAEHSAPENTYVIEGGLCRNYNRLVALKNKYDPKNFFHFNQNIKPTMSVTG